MTAILTWLTSVLLQKPYAIDLRDIFSETISNIFEKKIDLLGSCFLDCSHTLIRKC